MEPVELPIEDTIDLHSFQPQEVADLVTEYLHQALLKGFREVRIIHGRGIGVQRRIVHSILQKHPHVATVAEPPQNEGGAGATVVELRV